MENETKYIIGVLTVVILASAVYITFQNDAKFRIDDAKSTFYVKNENNRWVVSGREYGRLFDGTKKMYRSAGADIKITTKHYANTTEIIRTRKYIRGPVEVETWFFSGTEDINLFPVFHKIEIYNASGRFYRYEARDLVYEGKAKKLEGTEFAFGRNMKVRWDEGYNWARVYKSGILKVQYKIKSDYEVFQIRLFDPIDSSFIDGKRVIEHCIPVYGDIIEETVHYKTIKGVTYPNGTIVEDKQVFDYKEKRVIGTRQTDCIKKGVVNVSGKLISKWGSWCQLENNEICCMSNIDGGQYGAWFRNDGSVDKTCTKVSDL